MPLKVSGVSRSNAVVVLIAVAFLNELRAIMKTG